MRRMLQLCLSSLTIAVVMFATSAVADAHPASGTTVFLKAKPAHAARTHRTTSLLYSHGGAIEQSARVYIVFWGPQWSSGFATGGYTSAQAQTYVEDFFAGAGGSAWANSTIQYCQAASGTTQCGSGSVHPSNPSNELAGTWNDTSAVPSSPTQNQIAAEASALANHFGGVNTNANYMVFTPTGHSESGFGNWCAYHSSSGNLSYSYVPYQPDAGTLCGMNFVNGLDDAYGNGYFDGFSIVGGHEYAETVTDPYPNTGWLDSKGGENGDKCAWISSGQGAASNISLGSHSYAVQSLWSNAFNGGGGGCVLSY